MPKRINDLRKDDAATCAESHLPPWSRWLRDRSRSGPAKALNLWIAGGVQRRLQFDIEGARADPAPVHWAKNLDVADGVEAEAL